MRTLLRFVVAASAVALTPLAHADEPAQAVDLAKINAQFAHIAAKVIEGDPVISALALKIDEAYTDLDGNRIGLAAETTLNKSAWSDQPTSFGLVGRAESAPLDDVNELATITLGASLSTQVLAWAQFVYDQGAPYQCAPEARPGETDIGHQTRLAVCGELAKVKSATSFAQLPEILLTASVMEGAGVGNEIEWLEQQLVANPTDWRLKSKLASAKSELEFLQTIVPSVELDKTGSPKQLTLDAVNRPQSDDITYTAHAVATADAVSLTVTAKFPFEKKYLEFKKEVKEFLVELQNLDEQGLASLERTVKDYAEFAKEVVVGGH